MRFTPQKGSGRRDETKRRGAPLSPPSRASTTHGAGVAVRLVALASGLSLLIRQWNPSNRHHSNPLPNHYKLLLLPTTNGPDQILQSPNHLLTPTPQSIRVGVGPRVESSGSSTRASNVSASDVSLEDWSSVDYVACCGVGHRMTKMSDAYLVSRRLGLAFRAFWGYCANDDDGGEGERPVEVFHYLFGPQPKSELERLVAENSTPRSQHGNVTYDHYLRLSNQVKNFAYLRRRGTNSLGEAQSCPCTQERVDSDRSFYKGLRERFRGRGAVDEFRRLHFRDTGPSDRDGPPVLGIHIRAGNGEQGDFAARGRAVADLDAWLGSVAALLRRRDDWDASTVFVATDTPRVIPRLQALLGDNTSMTVVSFEQSRPEDGAGVLFGEQRRVDKSGGDRCLRGWVDGLSDMILLSHADVVIAARPSSFTQAMPLSLVFESSSRQTPEKEFCEVNRNATEMRCYRSVMDWCCNGSTTFSLDGISQTYDYISIPTTNASRPDMYKGFQRRTTAGVSPGGLPYGERKCPPRGLRRRQDCVPYDWSVFYPDSRRRPSPAFEGR